MWKDFATALCLVLVIEGIIPFLAPGRWRRLAVRLAAVDDRTIRLVGLVSMVSGAGLLYVVH
ncbi:MAG: DUF2065 domain-containing protein [Gammaproteobacteria bacterium]|jgi:uncharacterized protein YjeT (DUF2065 family)